MFSDERNHEKFSMVFRLPLLYFIGKKKNSDRKQTIKREGMQPAIYDFFFRERATKEVMKLLPGYIVLSQHDTKKK